MEHLLRRQERKRPVQYPMVETRLLPVERSKQRQQRAMHIVSMQQAAH